MVNTEYILKKVETLSSLLRLNSQNSIADQIDEIADERTIWDRMALRLAEELNSIISNESICEEAVK